MCSGIEHELFLVMWLSRYVFLCSEYGYVDFFMLLFILPMEQLHESMFVNSCKSDLRKG